MYRRKPKTGKRKPRKLPHVPAWEEILRLLNATECQRDRLVLLLGAFMALRVSEITKLQVPHLDFERKVLQVREGKGCKDRAVPIPDFLVGPLRGWCAARISGPVFPSRKGGGHMTTRAVQHLVKRMAEKAGLPKAHEPRAYSPHKLRHAAASRWLEQGSSVVEVRDLLGHSSIATTNTYAHANPMRLAKVVNG